MLMLRTEIDLIETTPEFQLRDPLEQLGARVNRWPVSDPLDWVEVMTRFDRAPYLLVCCEGSGEGFILPDLDPAELRGRPFGQFIGPDEIRSNSQTAADVTVITPAAFGGDDEIAAAWLDIGAINYVAADGNPRRTDSMMFVLHFFWTVMKSRSVAEAVEAASSIGGDAELYRLFSPQLDPPS